MGKGVIYAITSGKGGVGKTTTTANISTGLAMQGKKVAVIDADIGLRNLDVVMGLENRIVYDIVDVVEGRAKLKQALIKDKKLKANLQLLPAAQTREKDAVTPENMMEITKELAETFDYVFIDSPAGIERGFKNAIAGADEVIVVTNPEVSAVRDADRIVGLLEAAEKNPPKLIINRIRMDMVKRGEMLSIEDVLDLLEIEILGIVPDDEDIVISTNRGEPIVKTEESRPGKAYRNVVKRILGEKVPLLTLEEKKGILKKLATLFKK
ncbi:septum site-determining protein MinD [Haliovirga abyssi]|uniref:Septum site-determining protein MinD n=1 Tax=Haliovirga abyssi TaxID=2996794 RepID=A0AAU9DH14_9FUSO|nr:septum site-determining protein MinD [Haliovirga abyssi]BDU50767.1 site-determining protein [Haliovirga abyssi]